jgi:hypothetical protein
MAAKAGEGGGGSAYVVPGGDAGDRWVFSRGYVHFQLRLLTAEPQIFNIFPTESQEDQIPNIVYDRATMPELWASRKLVGKPC